jgi:DNA mismatch repair protein MutL
VRAIRQVLEKAPWLEHAPAASLGAASPKPSAAPGAVSTPEPPPNLSFAAPEFQRTQYSTKSFPLAEVREAVNSYTAGPSPAGPASELAEAGSTVQAAFRWRDLQIIGQLNHTYIVAQNSEAMYLVDQHAAHERVVFERLLASYRAGRMDVQNLLLPLVFDFSAEEVEALHAQRDAAAAFGLSVERMGPESLAVQAIPSLINEGAVSGALRRLAFELVQNGGSLAMEKAVGEIFASMACHSVVRAGQSQSVEQMHSLLAQMDDFPLSSFCPHGRPVFIRRGFAEIEREFGRIV